MDVTACIGTFGSPDWATEARELAIPSARLAGCRVQHVHGDTLHEARNEAIRLANTEWVFVLDGDDYICPDYLTDMGHGSDLELRAPQLCLHTRQGIETLNLRDRDIDAWNPCPIGTVVRRDLVLSVGGFDDYPAWEDWALFRKCVKAGATITHRSSLYHAQVRAGGRNSTVENPQELWERIRRENPIC